MLPPLGVSWEAEEPLQSDTENGSASRLNEPSFNLKTGSVKMNRKRTCESVLVKGSSRGSGCSRPGMLWLPKRTPQNHPHVYGCILLLSSSAMIPGYAETCNHPPERQPLGRVRGLI